MLERSLMDKQIELSRGLALPFTQFAVQAGIHLMAIGVMVANGLHLVGEDVPEPGDDLLVDQGGLDRPAAVVEYVIKLR